MRTISQHLMLKTHLKMPKIILKVASIEMAQLNKRASILEVSSNVQDLKKFIIAYWPKQNTVIPSQEKNKSLVEKYSKHKSTNLYSFNNWSVKIHRFLIRNTQLILGILKYAHQWEVYL